MPKRLFELDEPIRNVADYVAELNDLQGNILKSHGRGAAVHLFLTFHRGRHKKDKEKQVRKFLRDFAGRLTSAHEQLKQAERYKSNIQESFASLCLSATG